LFGETDPAELDRLVAEYEVAGPLGVVDQGMDPHGRRTETKAVPGRGAGKDEGCAFQEGGKDCLEVGGNLAEPARPGNSEQALPQLLEPSLTDQPLGEPDGVGRPCGQRLGTQHLAWTQFGGGGSSHSIKFPVKIIQCFSPFRKEKEEGGPCQRRLRLLEGDSGSASTAMAGGEKILGAEVLIASRLAVSHKCP